MQAGLKEAMGAMSEEVALARADQESREAEAVALRAVVDVAAQRAEAADANALEARGEAQQSARALEEARRGLESLKRRHAADLKEARGRGTPRGEGAKKVSRMAMSKVRDLEAALQDAEVRRAGAQETAERATVAREALERSLEEAKGLQREAELKAEWAAEAAMEADQDAKGAHAAAAEARAAQAAAEARGQADVLRLDGQIRGLRREAADSVVALEAARDEVERLEALHRAREADAERMGARDAQIRASERAQLQKAEKAQGVAERHAADLAGELGTFKALATTQSQRLRAAELKALEAQRALEAAQGEAERQQEKLAERELQVRRDGADAVARAQAGVRQEARAELAKVREAHAAELLGMRESLKEARAQARALGGEAKRCERLRGQLKEAQQRAAAAAEGAKELQVRLLGEEERAAGLEQRLRRSKAEANFAGAIGSVCMSTIVAAGTALALWPTHGSSC
jgi:hypothetical protein